MWLFSWSSAALVGGGAGDLAVVLVGCPGESVTGGSQQFINVGPLGHGWGWFVAHGFGAWECKLDCEVGFSFQWFWDVLLGGFGDCLAPWFDFFAGFDEDAASASVESGFTALWGSGSVDVEGVN